MKVCQAFFTSTAFSFLFGWSPSISTTRSVYKLWRWLSAFFNPVLIALNIFNLQIFNYFKCSSRARPKSWWVCLGMSLRFPWQPIEESAWLLQVGLLSTPLLWTPSYAREVDSHSGVLRQIAVFGQSRDLTALKVLLGACLVSTKGFSIGVQWLSHLCQARNGSPLAELCIRENLCSCIQAPYQKFVSRWVCQVLLLSQLFTFLCFTLWTRGYV